MTIRVSIPFLFLLVLLPTTGTASAFACPATYEKARLPVSALLGNIREGALLDSTQVLAGAPGEETKEYPALLAPDSETRKAKEIIQKWPLSPEEIKEGVLLICRYKEATGYLRFPLQGVTECSARLDASNPTSMKLLAMICR
ncbi:STY0301 family protein [Candidatus Magnetaquicoccus inordinatus]|uniref:STY0301 family protein n=1 Tax=Candidatus Magnetaquicoccus inordinatus TaxID=2496818 RepID=UPI00102ADB80|nr:STY0301 family protein [Candidatus Magnetaquicoccus inordinatus]